MKARGAVLVVEQDPAVRELLRAVLADAGYRAIAVSTRDAAASVLAKVAVGLLVVSVDNMAKQGAIYPDLRILRERAKRGTPVLAVTSDPAGLASDVAQGGGESHSSTIKLVVASPLDLDEFLNGVRMVMGEPPQS